MIPSEVKITLNLLIFIYKSQLLMLAWKYLTFNFYIYNTYPFVFILNEFNSLFGDSLIFRKLLH